MTSPSSARIVRAQSHLTELNGISARYLEWGSPDAPPIILLHGLRSYAHTWDDLAADLARDHRVLALDWRGRGKSGWDRQQRYHADAYVSDLEQWVDQLALEQFVLLGHSLGGANALLYSAAHRDRIRSLVIEDSGPTAADTGAGTARIIQELQSTPTRFETLAAARKYWRSIRPNITEQALDNRILNTIVSLPGGGWGWSYDLTGITTARLAQPPADLWPAVEQLTSPTLLIRGEQSDYCTIEIAEQMRERQPAIHTVTISDAGHYVHDDRPAEFRQAVRRFLADNEVK